MSQEVCSFSKLLKVSDDVWNSDDLHNFSHARFHQAVSHLLMPNIKLYVILFMHTILSSLLLCADLPGRVKFIMKLHIY